MRATAIEITDSRATVVLTPCWLARLFGAREMTISLWLLRATTTANSDQAKWLALYTGRPLHDLEYGSLIRDALDFRPRAELPVARLRGVQ